MPSAPYLELSTNCISSEPNKSNDNAIETTSSYKKCFPDTGTCSIYCMRWSYLNTFAYLIYINNC